MLTRIKNLDPMTKANIKACTFHAVVIATSFAIVIKASKKNDA